MERRKLLVTAGVLSATAFTATVTLGANFGLVGRAEPHSPIGRLADHHRVGTAAAGPRDAVAVAVTTPALGPDADD
jgi:hypothetical protein